MKIKMFYQRSLILRKKTHPSFSLLVLEKDRHFIKRNTENICEHLSTIHWLQVLLNCESLVQVQTGQLEKKIRLE